MESFSVSLVSYLPSTILDYLLDDTIKKPSEPPFIHSFTSCALFADISGFTKLSEAMLSEGPRGDEYLARHLNSYFELLVRTISGQGGDVFKFAGDALLVIWPPSDEDIQTRTRRACQCALEINMKLQEVEVSDGVVLNIKVGVGIGQINVLHVGGVFERFEYLATGPALAQAFAAEHHATRPEVVVSPDVWENVHPFFIGRSCNMDEDNNPTLNNNSNSVPLSDNYVFLKACKLPLRKVSVFKNKNQPKLIRNDILGKIMKYVPGAILPYVNKGEEKWASELRRITVLFVNLGLKLENVSEKEDIERIQRVVRSVQQHVYRYEGSMNKFLMDDKGSTLIAVFGLPPLAHEDDAVRGTLCGLAICSKLKTLGLKASIGVTSGLAFCGVVGSRGRREYSVLGDTVNLSARLMQHAILHNLDVLCDVTTQYVAKDRLHFQQSGVIQVKGKTHRIEVYRPFPIELASKLIGNENIVGKKITTDLLIFPSAETKASLTMNTPQIVIHADTEAEDGSVLLPAFSSLARNIVVHSEVGKKHSIDDVQEVKVRKRRALSAHSASWNKLGMTHDTSKNMKNNYSLTSIEELEEDQQVVEINKIIEEKKQHSLIDKHNMSISSRNRRSKKSQFNDNRSSNSNLLTNKECNHNFETIKVTIPHINNHIINIDARTCHSISEVEDCIITDLAWIKNDENVDKFSEINFDDYLLTVKNTNVPLSSSLNISSIEYFLIRSNNDNNDNMNDNKILQLEIIPDNCKPEDMTLNKWKVEMLYEIQDFLNEINGNKYNNNKRKGALIVIEGEMGFGKSLLLKHFCESCPLLTFQSRANPYEMHTSLRIWTDMFGQIIDYFLKIDMKSTDDEHKQEWILEQLSKVTSDTPSVQQQCGGEVSIKIETVKAKTWVELAACLNELLYDTAFEESKFTKSLTPIQRMYVLEELTIALINHLTNNTIPIVIVLDDAVYLDVSSWTFALALHNNCNNIILVLSTRPMNQLHLANFTNLSDDFSTLVSETGRILRLTLTNRPDEEILAIANKAIAENWKKFANIEHCYISKLPLPLSRLVVRKAQGNPLVIKEFVYELVNHRMLSVSRPPSNAPKDTPSTVNVRIEVWMNDAQDLPVPITLQLLYGAQLDKLNFHQLMLLKTASIIGSSFTFYDLNEMMPSASTSRSGSQNISPALLSGGQERGALIQKDLKLLCDLSILKTCWPLSVVSKSRMAKYSFTQGFLREFIVFKTLSDQHKILEHSASRAHSRKHEILPEMPWPLLDKPTKMGMLSIRKNREISDEWKPRYVTLHESKGVLCCWKTKEESMNRNTEPFMCFFLRNTDVSVDITDITDEEQGLMAEEAESCLIMRSKSWLKKGNLHLESRYFLFSCDNEKDKINWYNSINNSIEYTVQMDLFRLTEERLKAITVMESSMNEFTQDEKDNFLHDFNAAIIERKTRACVIARVQELHIYRQKTLMGSQWKKRFIKLTDKCLHINESQNASEIPLETISLQSGGIHIDKVKLIGGEFINIDTKQNMGPTTPRKKSSNAMEKFHLLRIECILWAKKDKITWSKRVFVVGFTTLEDREMWYNDIHDMIDKHVMVRVRYKYGRKIQNNVAQHLKQDRDLLFDSTNTPTIMPRMLKNKLSMSNTSNTTSTTTTTLQLDGDSSLPILSKQRSLSVHEPSSIDMKDMKQDSNVDNTNTKTMSAEELVDDIKQAISTSDKVAAVTRDSMMLQRIHSLVTLQEEDEGLEENETLVNYERILFELNSQLISLEEDNTNINDIKASIKAMLLSTRQFMIETVHPALSTINNNHHRGSYYSQRNTLIPTIITKQQSKQLRSRNNSVDIIEATTKRDRLDSNTKNWLNHEFSRHGNVSIDVVRWVCDTPNHQDSGLNDEEETLCNTWEAPIISLNSISSTKLFMIVFMMFESSTNLLSTLSIDYGLFRSLLLSISEHYIATNAYHNFIHAVDVCQALFYMLYHANIKIIFSPLERFSILMAALCHDLGHTGVNNTFHVNTRSELAIRYNDQSVLENYHASTFFSEILPDHKDIFNHFDEKEFDTFRKIMTSSILATDMTLHFSLLAKLRTLCGEELSSISLDMVDPYLTGSKEKKKIFKYDDKLLLMHILLHSADISNPCREWKECEQWGMNIQNEFFTQGDLEKAENIPVSMNFDRVTTNPFLCQINFIDFIVIPMVLGLLQISPYLIQLLVHLKNNRKKWVERYKITEPADDDIDKVNKREESFKKEIQQLNIDKNIHIKSYTIQQELLESFK